MTTQHPITPPPELVKQWAISSPMQHSDELWSYELFIAHQAARWGADQELNECCKWLPNLPPWSADDLHKHRRPKPPNLKEQALEALMKADGADHPVPVLVLSLDEAAVIRRALEELDD
jgi:hypothetical protein